ncbi:hypothetical protein NUU61_000763 [Penicillium alfredii]|uniref:O-methyltransferase C-terminal domain-containing protein n=1 Tax=Penicillium alfredii TaxID=1506179 RepID=A0A9W9KQ14_9EURO|nr:uncharacterized protein NUU61_000763 [Penicillium alfredii]KAJ5115004.1 hypothetical protein NUU61_000763 [Penicillium alfredii]
MTQAGGESHDNRTATNGTNDQNDQNGTNGQAHEAFVDGSVAISPNTPELVPGLLDQIASSGKTLSSGVPKARVELLDAARSLVYALETPREAMIRFCWSQSTAYAAVETGIDIGLFTVLSKDDNPKTASGLAEAVSADRKLVARHLKHLGAMGVIIETGPDEYRRTGFSTLLSLQRYSDGFHCMTACATAAIHALPAYLKKNGYCNPSNGKDCSFQIGFNTDLHFFEFLKETPEAAIQFNNHMSAYHQGRPSWMDVGFYDVPGLIKQANTGEQDVLLVDVGGNVGHDLSEFRRKWPNAPGRLVLQDLPEIIVRAKTVPLHSSIELAEHDFFTEQPIQGARAYYMHSILHDWTDDNCRKILKNLIPALKPGYSKVLINENVVPEMDAYWEITSLDIVMMSLFASMERTVDNWHTLLESVGLKITKIWTAERGVESLIECELA